MRRMLMAVAAAIMMSSAAMAQKNDSLKVKKLDKTEMIQKRTEMLVKKYGLDEEQSKKLQELNTKYADSLRFAMPMRSDRRAEAFKRSADNIRKVKRDSISGTPEKMAERQKPQMNRGRRVMTGAMKNYNAELKTIMTEEQYQKYTEDMQKQPERGGARGNGPRQSRNNQ